MLMVHYLLLRKSDAIILIIPIQCIKKVLIATSTELLLWGVCTKMQEKQPAMSFTHCNAHKLELAVLDSLKSDTNLE